MGLIDRDQAARRCFIDGLAAGLDVQAAARAAGIARQTPYQWAKRGDVEVDRALEARGALGGRGRSRAAAILAMDHPAAMEALEALRRVLADDSAPASVHIFAAKVALDVHRRLVENPRRARLAAADHTRAARP